MTLVNNNLLHRYKYKLNSLILILPFYFLYQALFPIFPDAWHTKEINSFKITPMPYNLDAPYFHDGSYVKDFILTFKQGNIKYIRQAYVNIGKEAIPFVKLQAGEQGILHGSQHGQEVHAIAPRTIKSTDKLWLTIEDWQGEKTVASWDIPEELIQR